jgi:hypothetical protein
MMTISDGLQVAVEEAVTAGLNAWGARRRLPPLRWRVEAEVMVCSFPHLVGHASAGDYAEDAAVETVDRWAEALGLNEVPAHRNGMHERSGWHGDYRVSAWCVVDRTAFEHGGREDVEE